MFAAHRRVRLQMAMGLAGAFASLDDKGVAVLMLGASAVVPRDFAATMARPHPVDPEPLSAADDGDGLGQRHRRTGEPGFQTFDVPPVFIQIGRASWRERVCQYV